MKPNARPRHTRRVRWKVTKTADGYWLPVVLIGEEPLRLLACQYKCAARKLARTKAEQLRAAGPA